MNVGRIRASTQLIAMSTVAVGNFLYAAPVTWDGSTGDTLLLTPDNWADGSAPVLTAPGDDWFFGTEGAGFTTVVTPTTGGRVSSIAFNAGTITNTLEPQGGGNAVWTFRGSGGFE